MSSDQTVTAPKAWLERSIQDKYIRYYSEEELDNLKVLGNGGFGIVYKARHKTLDIAVAIKCLWPRKTSDDEDYYKVFVKEVSRTSDLYELSHVTTSISTLV